jgi:hypothetical protein
MEVDDVAKLVPGAWTRDAQKIVQERGDFTGATCCSYGTHTGACFRSDLTLRPSRSSHVASPPVSA